MDTHEKLDLLGQAARYDDCVLLSGASAGLPPGEDAIGLFAGAQDLAGTRDVVPWVTRIQTPDGKSRPVLKVLQTSACQHNCRYCGFRAGRDFRRATFGPDELAKAFDLTQRAGIVQGMFLSSGIIGAVRSMDNLIATTELVRRKYGYRGYIHLKILPGAEPAQIERAVELADRVSVNLEGPTGEALASLAPQKRREALVGSLRVAADAIRRRPATPPGAFGGARLGISTQFVVGPGGESDLELLTTSQMLYREIGLARAYYSAFSPVSGTPLEHETPTHPLREHRLYQADFLLKRYRFAADELPYDEHGRLREDRDPKATWAEAHPERFPIEVNRAPLAELLRVPGIGPHSARAIVRARREGILREVGDLRKLGARADHAAPFVLLAGKRPARQFRMPW
jgi:predicted DNA-binding helix-hairpin-helix protein